MSKVILSINAGSSSVKVSLYSNDSKQPRKLAEAQVDGLTAPPPKLKYERGRQSIKGKELDKTISSQEDAFKAILDHLTADEGLPELSDPEDVEFATHRIVHGGDYDGPKVIDGDTFKHIEELSNLAPLHNAPALGLVKAISKQLPKTTNVAFFDTSFHNTIPTHIGTYPISPDIAKRNKLRKYGFHGLSYAFITQAVAFHLNKTAEQLNIIALHLGSGASACAIRQGKSLDTSMGLTPLAGLPGATRSGSVDPSLVFHYTNEAGELSPISTKEMHITTAEEILNKKSGWKALTGTTDFGKISASDDASCQLAFDIFVDRVLGFVGSYYVKLEGKVDALVFAGGIGEKGERLRTEVVKGVGCLGFQLDEERNRNPGSDGVVDIGKDGASHRVLICQTDEQFEMARECVVRAEQFRNGSK